MAPTSSDQPGVRRRLPECGSPGRKARVPLTRSPREHTYMMTRDPLTDDEFEELDRFLLDVEGVDASMDISMLDGYFAAILSGPKTILPSEWLRWVWDTPPRTLSRCSWRTPPTVIRFRSSMNGVQAI